MIATDLRNSFRSLECYYRAPRWQKPFRNPRRFLRNQVRRWIPHRLGETRRVAAFHMPDFTVVSGEAVGEAISAYGIYEPELTWAFVALLKPGQVVVDVGMHLGYYTTLFALLVGDQGAVHAFEPTPSTRSIAAANVARFKVITVHGEAVWSSLEKMRFYDYGPHWMGFNSFTAGRFGSGEIPPATPFDVQTTTIDQFRNALGRSISLIKIDAESAERQILAGAIHTLRSDRPILSLEVGDFDTQPASAALINFLADRDYAAWEITGRILKRHQLRPRYSYDNLLFAHRSIDLTLSDA